MAFEAPEKPTPGRLVEILRMNADAGDVLCGHAADEIERLREAIRRLAEQEATLSLQGGSVTVTMDATITDEEREALWFAVAYAQNAQHTSETTLRGLLERMAAANSRDDRRSGGGE